MPIIRDELLREIERQEELEDREYLEIRDDKKRKHELKILDRKIKIKTRWQAFVNVVKQIMLMLPRCLAVIGIVFLVALNRPIPKVLEDILS
jgi:hypothetical protein